MPSLALITWTPLAPAGILKVVLKLPLESLVKVTGPVFTLALSYVMEIGLLARKPAPVTVTLVSTGPEVGLIDIVEVTVNVCVKTRPAVSWTVSV